MVWNYLNFSAMVVGYVTIVIILLAVLVFIALVIREKIIDMKWKKRKEMEKQSSPAAEKPAEQPKEAPKEAEKPNVQISIK